MQKEELIKLAYEMFSIYEKPRQCTTYTDFEDSEFNAMLLSATRWNLTVEQAGTVVWGPILSMTPQSLAYFMPRLIEFAVTGVIDCDGNAFFYCFINFFYDGPDNEKFSLFGSEQKRVMAETFNFLCQNYHEQLKYEGWFEECCQAVKNWGHFR